jgi:post-segregation antitoxin (ccd killing protein)
MTLRSTLGLLSIFLISTAACAPVPEPEIASSATQPGYAESYPAAMQSVMEDINADDEAARTIDIAIPRYPDGLKSPNWKQVRSIHESADAAGRSQAYVERSRETEGARAFFKEKKEAIGKKVAGTAQYVAKQKGCDVDVSGAVMKALEDAVEKETEERMREKNEAHRLIERYRTALGKENAAALEKQADDISRASYIVNVELVEAKIRLRAMIAEAEQVKKTLDEGIAAERAFQGESGRSDAEKKAAGERIASMDKSRGMIDAAITQGKDLESRVETRIEAAQKRHTDAMTALKDAITKRGG